MTKYHLEKLISQRRIDKRIAQMGAEIAKDYSDMDLTLVMILLGAAKFGSKLHTEISSHREPRSSVLLEALGVTSYDETTSNGKPEFWAKFKDPEKNIRGRKVLVAEDIIHTGHTLADTVLPFIWQYEPASVAVATLLIKDDSREVEVGGKIYRGFHVGKDDYVVGEFLDMAGSHRGVSGISRVVFD